jgi:hypothetical protein
LSHGCVSTITETIELIVLVEACFDLSNPIRSAQKTNTLTGGSAHFSDPHWKDYPGRFYRLRSP